MLYEYETRANAKINIFLRVCGRYPNGYHRLYMLMQEIDLGDDIKVVIDDGRDFDVSVLSDRADFDMKKDLCYRAAAKFYDELGDEIPRGFTEITAIKHVPSEAGLGGGSSDAAAVLKILNSHYGDLIGMERMTEIAAGLGADVPFFLYGHSAICEGIGEIVTPVPTLEGLHMILVKPAAGVSTAVCFKACDEMTEAFDEEQYKADMERIFGSERSAADRISEASSLLTNDLEAPALIEVPLIGQLRDLLAGTDCLYAAMSGSGSTVFAIYDDEDAADRALAKVSADPLTDGCVIRKTRMV